MFLEFDFVEGPFYKKAYFDYWFSALPGPWGTSGALRVHWIKKLH